MRLSTLIEAASSDVHKRLLFIQTVLLEHIDDPDLDVELVDDTCHITYKDLIDKTYQAIDASINPIDHAQYLRYCHNHDTGSSSTTIQLGTIIATLISAIRLIKALPESFRRISLKSYEVQLGLKVNKTIISCINEDSYEIISAQDLLAPGTRRRHFSFARTVDLLKMASS